MAESRGHPSSVEWPTLVVLVLCYLLWAIGTTLLASISLLLGVLVVTLTIAQFSSLQHEILHGHPFRNRWLNEALVFPSLTLFIPYLRFRDQHLEHHNDSRLTDPYDDPETNYLDPMVWNTLSRPARIILKFNNTLFGRLLVGALVSQRSFMLNDWRLIRAGDRQVRAGWLWHMPSVLLVVWWLLSVATMPIWAYLLSAYMGISILKIRTFLEHRAHEKASGRTVVIDDHGPLALLFLNNNLHVVHHMHPKAAWYVLPGMFSKNKEHYLTRNDGYFYKSYRDVFARHFLRAKDPVPHPLWHSDT